MNKGREKMKAQYQKTKTFLKSQKGVALMITLSVLTLLLVMAMGLAGTQIYEEMASKDFGYSIMAQYAAEAGINRAILLLREEAQRNYQDSPQDSLTVNEPGIGNVNVNWYYDAYI